MHHCLVIDDEYLARERISSFVMEQVNWQVDGESGEYEEAESLLLKFLPELCFMDINIIGGSGIEFAKIS
jgi:DNA-binding NarL/FixJ family response regulator